MGVEALNGTGFGDRVRGSTGRRIHPAGLDRHERTRLSGSGTRRGAGHMLLASIVAAGGTPCGHHRQPGLWRLRSDVGNHEQNAWRRATKGVVLGVSNGSGLRED
jgi:hypothetical protein